MLIKMALDEFPESLALLKHQQTDAGAVQQISCQFHTRSTPSTKKPVPCLLNYKYSIASGILKVFSSSLKTDLRVLEWIISDMKKRAA